MICHQDKVLSGFLLKHLLIMDIILLPCPLYPYKGTIVPSCESTQSEYSQEFGSYQCVICPEAIFHK
jgi:hypothetical protein